MYILFLGQEKVICKMWKILTLNQTKRQTEKHSGYTTVTHMLRFSSYIAKIKIVNYGSGWKTNVHLFTTITIKKFWAKA